MPITPPGQERIPASRTGYPLSYFAATEPFATWLGHSRRSREGREGERAEGRERAPRPGAPTRPPGWTEEVYLERFTTRRMDEILGGPDRGAYEHILEFTTTKEVAIALPEPKGTVALFGKYGKKGKEDPAPARLRLRFIAEPKYGRLVQLDVSGAIRFRLPQSLVRPVVERNRRWVDNPTITHVLAPLDNSTLTLRRGERPELSSPLVAPNVTVRIGETGVIASLQVARVDISGTAARPKIQFDRIRLAYLTS